MPASSRRCSPFLLLLVAWFAAGGRAQGTPIGFEETFALAADRGKVLELLIPGTDDYYYYSCLQRQQAGAFADVPALLTTWIERHGRNPRVEEIEIRQALLTYERDPAAAFAFLRKHLGATFHDARTAAGGARPDLPTALDPQQVSQAAWLQRARALHPGSLEGVRDAVLPAVAAGPLDDDALVALMLRLSRPDLPNLVALVLRQLDHPRSSGFGSLPVHKNLLLPQLDELAQQRPALLGEPQFVDAYVRRLQPSADVQWQHDSKEREQYLDRLWAFAQRLPPVENTFRAHVLWHRLQHDLQQGTPDRERLFAYLRLPRPAGYVHERLRQRGQREGSLVRPGEDYPTGLATVHEDEGLVRQYLEHFFATEESYAPYAELLAEDWLQRVFATTKILAGQGDMERWYSMLGDASDYEALKERVELQFAPTQRTLFAADEPVAIDLDVKNVPTLLVKVFELDAYGYQRDHQKDIDASIDLDGLVANEETTHTYAEPPLRRVRRHFEFASLQRPGTYVVEFLGNGTSSRAVIQKGSLHFVDRLGAAGHVLTVLDEQGKPCADAAVWCAGHEYASDEHGEVNVPFGGAQETRRIVLRRGAVSSLRTFHHRAEAYQLAAGVFVDREALLAGQRARILVRPTLSVHRAPVSLTLLEQTELVIAATDHDGVASTQVVRDLKLGSDAEYVHTIAVPEGLARLSVQLRGRVMNLGTREPVALASSEQVFECNRIDQTVQLWSPQLGRNADGWFVELRGKNGELLAGRSLTLRLQHRDFLDPFTVALQTAADGRVRLGALAGVDTVEPVDLPQAIGEWSLLARYCEVADVLHGTAGATLRVPLEQPAAAAVRGAVALFELRGGAPARDRSDKLRLVDAYLELRGLEAGDYQLWLPAAEAAVEVRIAAGAARDGWGIGRDRWLELAPQAPLQIARVAADGAALAIQLGQPSPTARVHVFATRWLEPFAPWQRLAAPPRNDGESRVVERDESSYFAGRQIGDEYRYILARRGAAKFPGNMLKRPSLLLNPWSPEESSTGERRGAGPGSPGPSGRGHGSGAGGKRGGRGRGEAGTAGTFPDLEYLPQPAPTLCNLRADAQGLVRVPLADLGQGQLVHVVAIDGDELVYATHALPEQPLQPRSRQLQNALDSTAHFTQQRRIEFVDGGGTAVIDQAAAARTEAYGSLAAVFRLFQTLGKHPDLDQFAFLLRWPQLKDDEQRTLYSQHACHELHFFLQRKDPKFFAAVVRPFLANKASPTFLDQYLLDADLTPYLEPWAFAQLNLVERILLLQKLPGAPDDAARHVRELFELLPPDPVGDGVRFATALQSGALEGAQKHDVDADGLGIVDRERLPAAEDKKLAEEQKPRAPGAPPPAADPAAAAPAPAEKAAAILFDEFDKQALSLGARRKAKESEDLERRRDQRQLYRELDPTRQYVEHAYWHRRLHEQGSDMIPANAFWLDFAAAPAGAPFRSPRFVVATSSVAEMLLALAVIDLPFAAEPPAETRDGAKLTLRPATPLLLVRQEVLPAVAATAPSPVLIGQNYFRLDDRYRFENGERRDHYVTGEFLLGVAYGCQVVLTNPTSTPRTLDLLLQIPQGALPIDKGFYTRGRAVPLGPFATVAIEYAFYFPAAGACAHFPAHVAAGGALIGAAAPATLTVVATPTTVDTTSWEHVSQDGSADDVLRYLDAANLQRTDLARIAWRMQDRAFFTSVLTKLRGRHSYHDRLWAYALLHQDEAAAREYLRHVDGLVGALGGVLASPLLAVDPVERRSYQHVEFEPLVNARAHRFGGKPAILNRELAQQYQALLSVLCRKHPLGDADWLATTYYLLVQDRIAEALAAFAAIRKEALPSQLQYDYLAAYLDFFSDQHAKARGIAEAYRDHPVPHWRARFHDVLAQLDEADGKAPVAGDGRDRTQRQTELAATEPQLDLEVAAGRVTLRHQNLDGCELRYYRMDVEFAFSTNPFAQQGAGATSYVQPARRDQLVLAKDQRATTFELPAEFRRQNVLVEARGGGLLRRQLAFASALSVHTSEAYGHLQVTAAADGKPQPKVYVKVYARLPGGAARFHKDGYTDLRGRFDYASVSEPGTEGAERYAVLVLSEQDGAVIREVAPPNR